MLPLPPMPFLPHISIISSNARLNETQVNSPTHDALSIYRICITHGSQDVDRAMIFSLRCSAPSCYAVAEPCIGLQQDSYGRVLRLGSASTGSPRLVILTLSTAISLVCSHQRSTMVLMHVIKMACVSRMFDSVSALS